MKPASDNPIRAVGTNAAPQAVTFDVLRLQINAAVTRNALSMVEAMIDHAREGQHQALKYLFEMIGLYPATVDEKNPHEGSLAKILLNRLGIAEEADHPRDRERTAVSVRPDAVE